MRLKMMGLTLLGLISGQLAATQPALADRTIPVHARSWLNPGEMTTVQLGAWVNVQKLFVQAEGVRCDTTVEVLVNGDLKGTMHLPGYDPSYAVTVAETTADIQLRNVGNCMASIQGINAVVNDGYGRGARFGKPRYPAYNGPVSAEALNTSAAIAAEAIELVDVLRDGATLQEQAAYLMPIKKVAARTYATANARCDLSYKVYMMLQTLKAQIDFAQPYLEQTFERDSQFDAATTLLGLRERIEALTQ